MRPGWLRHRITIQQKTATRDDYGEPVVTWSALATVWAGVEPLRGKHFLEAAVQAQEATHKIRMRYYPGVTAEMRVIFGSRTFEQVAPPQNILERDEEIHLFCREMV